jgi:hypothetical protein
VIWSASSGSITPGGLYTASSPPPPGGDVTVSVQTTKGARDERHIHILPIPVPQPAPEAPTPPALPIVPTPGPAQQGHQVTSPLVTGPLSTPAGVLIGRKLYLTVKTSQTGLLRISASVYRRAIGSCTRRLRGGLSFTCAFILPSWVSIHSPISVSATLRIGRHLLHASRAALVPTAMKAMEASHAFAFSGLALSTVFFCGP